MKCPTELIGAAVGDRLDDASREQLLKHLGNCETCRDRLDQETATKRWWEDASRFLDESVLSDPENDVDDSSQCGARLFEDGDPVGELRSMGAIDPPTHPEMLGKLGRYTIEREIGAGGMGVVLKAHDAELSRTVAIKVLAPHLARSGAARQRFIREGRAAAAVVHDNVVAIHEVDTSGKLPTLVMRYVDGVSLQRHVDLYGPLSVRDALRIAAQTAAGLAAAHRQGIIHRDVKPANIMVNHSCNRAWISDFGLARAVDDASLTRTGFIAGTPHYMSPEQARGGDVGPRSDLFSLGAVIYFMFAARPPWRAERSLAVLHRIVQHEHRPLWKLNADVPRRVSDLVDRLLQKRVADRPESAAEVQVELEKALSELQNPSLQVDVAASGKDGLAKTKWWTRPWFVAPVAAMFTATACLTYTEPLRPSASMPLPEVRSQALPRFAGRVASTTSRLRYEPAIPAASTGPKSMSISQPVAISPELQLQDAYSIVPRQSEPSGLRSKSTRDWDTRDSEVSQNSTESDRGFSNATFGPGQLPSPNVLPLSPSGGLPPQASSGAVSANIVLPGSSTAGADILGELFELERMLSELELRSIESSSVPSTPSSPVTVLAY